MLHSKVFGHSTPQTQQYEERVPQIILITFHISEGA